MANHFRTGRYPSDIYCADAEEWGIVAVPGGSGTDITTCSGCHEPDPTVKAITEDEADALPNG